MKSCVIHTWPNSHWVSGACRCCSAISVTASWSPVVLLRSRCVKLITETRLLSRSLYRKGLLGVVVNCARYSVLSGKEQPRHFCLLVREEWGKQHLQGSLLWVSKLMVMRCFAFLFVLKTIGAKCCPLAFHFLLMTSEEKHTKKQFLTRMTLYFRQNVCCHCYLSSSMVKWLSCLITLNPFRNHPLAILLISSCPI